MEPTFVSGDSWYNREYVAVDEVTYHFNNPARGQIIVFHDPLDETEFFIKRIIGLPGDVISIHNGKVYVNGNVLNEPYLPSTLVMAGDATYAKVPPDNYFVMGDNRMESFDSRNWGTVKRSEIVGVVRLGVDFWPQNFKFDIYDQS
jgi:signal peptidase I